jgi:uncharacterized membrane protein
MQKSIPQKVEFIFTWLTLILIGIGILTLIRRYKEMSFPKLIVKKSDFLKNKFEVEYFMIALACCGLLVAAIAIPYLSVGYSLERVYLLAIVILSPFFLIGGIMLSRRLKVKASLTILVVLILYFMSTSGVTYQICSVPRSVVLNSEGEQYNQLYVHDQENYASRWLKDYVADHRGKIYADHNGLYFLMSQGRIPQSQINMGGTIVPVYQNYGKIDGYIYLRYQNVVKGELLADKTYDITNYSRMFDGKNKIYTSGGSEIFE